jgi:Holliday junction DNA helicase RuvA
MIGQLRGIILEKQPPLLLLSVNGVGYEIDAPMSTFYRLPDVGQEIILHTHLIVREDAHHLYGFNDKEDRAMFRTLLKVNGVGPRMALTILSSMDTAAFVRCIAHNDIASLVNLPGVGKKTAERLLIEMRDKIAHWLDQASAPVTIASGSRNSIVQDAISALIALGYKPTEASRVVSKVDDGALSSEDMIRRALQERV